MPNTEKNHQLPYRTDPEDIVILAIYHGAQQWPEVF